MAVDPGLSGAVCFMRDGELLDVQDVPTLPDNSNREVDVPRICRWIDKWSPEFAIIENVQPMPSIPGVDGVRRGMGAASSFRFGFAVGQLRATAACYGMRVRLVHPRTWKRHYGLKGPDKEQSRQLALELLPTASPYLTRRKDHNRAESVLIALYATETLGFL
jgi:crossover junction endodeoxyribonuclease RuvC